jgi:hypothetical protein
MPLKQSTTRNLMFLMVDSSDHVTGKTGLTVTVTVSKDGGAFGAAGGTVTEISSGWYKIALTTTDTNTVGDIALHCTSTGADPTDIRDQVSARLPDDLAYPATSGRSMVVDSSGLVDANAVKVGPTGSGTAQTAGDIPGKTNSLTFTGAGKVDASIRDWLGSAPNALISGRVDSNPGALQAGVITATSIAGDAITAAKIAADAIGASELATDAVTEIVTAVLTTAMTESYNTDGAAPTLAQALFLLISGLLEFAISGTTLTAKKLDGSTTAATFTLDDATDPTSITRAS